MALESSYGSRAAGSAGGGSNGDDARTTTKGDDDPKGYWSLSKLRKCYTDYLFSKREEIDEQIDARRYYHGSQWTAEQLRVMQKRKQPVMTFNRVARKIDGVVGLIEKQRQDPKAYPRTPQHEEGADLATAAIRYVLDEQEWNAKSPIVATDGAVDGVGGIELLIEQGDQGDPEIGLQLVDVQSFFYDPRSYKDDFSDARYLGVGKWVDEDVARDMFPKAEDALFEGSDDSDLQSSTDRELRWFSSNGQIKRVRLVDIWYRHGGKWCWAIFTGAGIIEQGHSPFKDEKKQDICKFLMFSGNVDQDGDRYGFVRNMKSAQDGINARQSKMQHILASRRLILSQGAVDDIEKVRAEWARPDGVILTNKNVNDGVKADDQSFDFAGWSKMLELNLAEIENFGPNRTLIGEGGVDTRSGRAIAMLHQAGMAELGPYILAYRGWKVRIYRAVWNAIQQHWKAERWIRVTDDEGLAEFVSLNKLEIGQDGQPTIVNKVGSLDVDIILDEAQDSINLQAEAFEILKALGPTFVDKYPDIAVELSPLDSATKKKFRDKFEQAAQNPQQQLLMAGEAAKVKDTEAASKLKEAQTVKTYIEAQVAPMEAMNGEGINVQPQDYEPPPEIQDAQAIADIELTQAKTESERAKAFKTSQEGALAPQQLAADMHNAEADRHVNVHNAQADRQQDAQQANADRSFQARQSSADRRQNDKNADADRKASIQQAKMKSKPKGE
jgi:hypothetical protein